MQDSAFLEKLKNFLDNAETIYNLGTNSPFIFNTFKTHKNVAVFKERSDISNNNIALNNPGVNIVDTLAEMVSVKNANKIYAVNELGWVSNFVFYALVTNKDLKVECLYKKFYS